MASELRLKRLQGVLHEEMSRLLKRELEFPRGTLVTVTRIDLSEDVYYATVFVSILGEGRAEALAILQQSTYYIQQELNRRMRTRPVPRVSFRIDEAEERREAVEKTLAELKKKKEL